MPASFALVGTWGMIRPGVAEHFALHPIPTQDARQAGERSAAEPVVAPVANPRSVCAVRVADRQEEERLLRLVYI